MIIFFQEYVFKCTLSAKTQPFCYGFNVLNKSVFVLDML